LRVTRDCKIWMIQKIECFRPKTEVHTCAELKALPQCQIKLREARAPQDISTGSAKLPWRQNKRAWIEPAFRGPHSGTVWAGASVGMTDQVWPLRLQQRLSTRIIEGQHWGKRNVAVDASDAGNLPSSEAPVVIERQLSVCFALVAVLKYLYSEYNRLREIILSGKR
jgi:hypothetical protein